MLSSIRTLSCLVEEVVEAVRQLLRDDNVNDVDLQMQLLLRVRTDIGKPSRLLKL